MIIMHSVALVCYIEIRGSKTTIHVFKCKTVIKLHLRVLIKGHHQVHELVQLNYNVYS
jgi:hypothetical protein